MKISLILATVGRVEEVRRFLESLATQDVQADIELLVVDQNPDDRLTPLLTASPRYSLVYLRCSPGLSKARNLGRLHASGDIFAYPDDDCWYPDGLLRRIVDLLETHEDWDGVTGRPVDAFGQPSAGRWAAVDGWIEPRRPWHQAISFTMFLRRSVVDCVGDFDEMLGVGCQTPWQSGEETDYVIRALRAGFRLRYLADLHVGHPDPLTDYNAQAVSRGLRYARGFGRVLRKHRFPLHHAVYWWLRPAAGALIAAAKGQRGRAAYHLAVLRGRLEGWWARAD